MRELLERVEGLSPRSKQAIDAFVARKPFKYKPGDSLATDGKKLEKLGMGGHVLARWRRQRIAYVGEESTKFEDRVIRYLKRKVGKWTLTFDYERQGHEKSLTFEFDTDSLYAGQIDGVVVAKLPDGKVVGRLDWSEFRGEYSVKFIEVAPEYRRTGVGGEMFNRFLKHYKLRRGDVDLGMTTELGSKFFGVR